MVVLQALIGHQYGTVRLPAQVEVSEFQLLLQESQQAGVGTEELERAYERDENSIPPSYRLRHLKKHTCCPQVNIFVLPTFLLKRKPVPRRDAEA